MGNIKVLEQHIADKIAAGEVIERPLSVVKELLENSIDAQASFIEVEISDGGISFIRIRDNGIGMDQEDLSVAFKRHATSKISDFKDLFALTTFGFRGEALPSIAAVAQVEMQSCLHDRSLGYKIRLSGGVEHGIEEVGTTNGTTIEVKNLFYNIPARRKFLKSNSYEAGLIGDLVSKYALGHPNIRFKLISNGQIQIDTAGLDQVSQRMIYFYGQAIENKIIHLPATELMPNHWVEGWLLREDHTRNNRNQETVFINERLVKSVEINRAIEEGYYTLVPKGRFPIVILKLTIPSDKLDINIHPAKLEVKIHGYEQIKSKMIEVIKDCLWEANIAKSSFLSDEYASFHQKQLDMAKQSTKTIKEIIKEPLSSTKIQKLPFFSEVEKTVDTATSSQVFEVSQSGLAEIDQVKEKESNYQSVVKNKKMKEYIPRDRDNATAMTTLSSIEPMPEAFVSTEKEMIQLKGIHNLQLIGQLNQSFILAQNSEGLFIIDQHTCHERILYESYMSAEEEKEVVTEELLIPVTLNLTAKQDSVLIEHIVTLRNLGFIIENFGARSYLIRALPLGLKEMDKIDVFFIDLLDDLSGQRTITLAIIKEKTLTMASCKAAVKARQPLTEVEMLTLLHDLAQTQNAHTCPHGRPIIYKISMEELYHIFKRGNYPYAE